MMFCKKILVVLLTVALLLGASASSEAAKKKKRQTPVDRYASIVIDYQSGVVLSERNANKSLHPASLTKMMTLYMTFAELQKGTLMRSTRLPVSSRAASQAPSELALKAGQNIRVEDAILGLVTKSANDAAVVLAEGIAGSEKRFAQRMTETARQLGMTRTRFTNASGLHDVNQVSTARDMAILSQALIRDFPRYYKYFSTNTFSYAGVQYNNHNRLMQSYTGMDGIKTGYVYASGFNLAASATRGEHRLIGIVFGGRTAKSRNDHMAELLDKGFTTVQQPRIAARINERLRLAAAGQQIKTGVKVASASSIKKIPERRPAASTQQPQKLAQIAPAMGMNTQRSDTIAQPLVEQGDTDDTAQPTAFIARPLNTHNIGIIANQFAVQIGAFSSFEASMNALKDTKSLLPQSIAQTAQHKVVPLMTNRGLIYRARITGLQESQAHQACRHIPGTCLIMAAQ